MPGRTCRRTGFLPRGSADSNAGGQAQRNIQLPERREPDLVSGENIFTTTCAVCHGKDGMGGLHGGVALMDTLTEDLITTTLVNGRNNMPAFGTMYSAEQVQDVAGYILQELTTAVAEAQ